MPNYTWGSLAFPGSLGSGIWGASNWTFAGTFPFPAPLALDTAIFGAPLSVNTVALGLADASVGSIVVSTLFTTIAIGANPLQVNNTGTPEKPPSATICARRSFTAR